MWSISAMQGCAAILAASGIAAVQGGPAGHHHQHAAREQTQSTFAGKKAGAAGDTALEFWKSHLGWYHNWTPSPPAVDGVTPIAMLWGGGIHGGEDAERYAEFKNLTSGGTDASRLPSPYVLGFNEPDCAYGHGSAGLTVRQGADAWDELLAPLPGSVTLVSPALCKQLDGEWLDEFAAGAADLQRHMWGLIAVHVFKATADEARQVVEYYNGKLGFDVVVTEFACVHDGNGFEPCGPEESIDFIREVVPMFQAHPNVVGYAYTDAPGNGDDWKPTTGTGDAKQLTAVGQAYLDAIKGY